jgi:sterol desaturase/sphingolipid hydroxylase (fatty acid hydroxylase superfamily)
MLNQFRLRLIESAVFFLLGFVVEAIVAADENSSRSSLGFNCLYGILYEGFNATGGVFLLLWLNTLLTHVAAHPLIHFNLTDHGKIGAAVLIAIGALFVKDAFFYGCHRLQHSKWLWPEHMLHHSDQHMNVSTALRHHWLENMVQTIFVVIPMAAFIRPPALTVIGVILAIRGFDYFIHLNARIYLGPFIASPLSHRIHHSSLPEHMDKNFAAIFPVIDMIFGTWYPAVGVPPPTGLCSGERVNSVFLAAVLPFREWKAQLWRDPVADDRARGYRAS